MFEVEAVDGVLRLQAGQTEAAFDGAAVARFQFQVGERFQGCAKLRFLAAASAIV